MPTFRAQPRAMTDASGDRVITKRDLHVVKKVLS
jgi:hypothetical protein